MSDVRWWKVSHPVTMPVEAGWEDTVRRFPDVLVVEQERETAWERSRLEIMAPIDAAQQLSRMLGPLFRVESMDPRPEN